MQRRLTILACALALTAVPAPAAVAQSGTPNAQVAAENSTNRDLDMAFPFRIGPIFAGDLGVRILRNGEIYLPADLLFQLASPYLSPAGVNLLGSVPSEDGFQSLRRLREAGLNIFYEPQRLEILLLPDADQAVSKDLSLGSFAQGAIEPTPSDGLSAFLNLFNSFQADYEDSENLFDRGNIRTLMDGAVHFGGLAIEGEASLDEAQGFRRLGTRAVYDDLDNLLRFQAGDVLTGSTGFQVSEDILGISVIRSSTVLRPGVPVYSTGAQSFRLERPSSVDVFVNGAQRRSLELQPGDYNLEDLGFSAGGNEVRLDIEDDAGRRETLEFTVFFDSSLLATGVTEFGLAGGIRSDLSGDERTYSDDDPVVSGFVRHGMTDALTVGLNAQGDDLGGLFGAEATLATPIGAFSIDAAYSKEWHGGSGYGVDFDYTLSRFKLYDEDDANRRLLFSFEHESSGFSVLGGVRRSDADFRLAGSYSQDLFDDYRLALSGGYEFGGEDIDHRSNAAVTLSGPFLTDRTNFAATLGYSDGYSDFKGVYALFSISFSLGPSRHASSSFDSRNERVQFNYLKSAPDQIGAIDYSLRAITDEDRNSVSGSVRHTANRFELQADHDLTTPRDFGQIQTNRTTFRANTALVFAGNKLTLSRPVREGFAILDLHSSLSGNELVVEPGSAHKRYETDFLGPAVVNDLTAYSRRSIAVDVEDLPLGYDLGAGAFDITPRYKAGYAFTVGSDYSVTMVATALDQYGDPVALVSGTAREEDSRDRGPVQVFTNRDGRLVAQGMRPGRWVIELAGLRYIAEIPDEAVGIVRLGALSPANGR